MIFQNGVPPYFYKWSTGGLKTTYNETLLKSFTPGNYSVKVSDWRGCLFQLPFTIDASPPLQAQSLFSIPSCPNNPDGAVSITITNGSYPFNFNWSNGSTMQNLTDVSLDSYTLEIKDSKNCKFSNIYNVGTAPSTPTPSTIPCGFDWSCKGIHTFSESSTYERLRQEECLIEHVCTASNQIEYREHGYKYWQTDYNCLPCCQQELVCSLSGTPIGYLPCNIGLQRDPNPDCCGLMWAVCSCTGLKSFYSIDFSCPYYDQCVYGGSNFANTKIDKTKDYVFYLDPVTNEKYAFTFDEIVSKKYKSDYPNMPDIDLNQKVVLDNKNMTLYDAFKPKRFLFSVSPNPFEGSPNISLFLSKTTKEDRGSLKVTDELGRVLITEQLENLHELLIL